MTRRGRLQCQQRGDEEDADGGENLPGLSSSLASSVQTFEAREIFAEEKRAPEKAPLDYVLTAMI